MSEYNYGPLEHELAGGFDESRSEFDQVFEDMNAPEYPATCDGCGMEGTNASMEGHECVESDHGGRCLCGSWDYQHEDGTGACVWADCDCKQFISEESSLLTKEEAELVMGAIPLQALPGGPPCVYCSGNGVNCCRTQRLRQQRTTEAARGIWRVGFNGHEVMCGHDYIVSCTGKKYAEQIVTEHNEHRSFTDRLAAQAESLAQVVAERNQLREALAGLSCRHPYCWCGTWVGGEHEAECLAAQEAMRPVTIETEEEGR